MLKNNFITYGSLNNATKVNSTLLRVWAEILNKTDGSNLLLGGNHYSDEVASKIKNELNEFGVEESRVLILKRTEKHEELLRYYNRIDIALDTFPYNGVTTSCEAMWMRLKIAA